jgi:hypothetical protein
MGGRRVILLRQRPGADRKLAVRTSITVPPRHGDVGFGAWGWYGPTRGRVYARVTPKVGDGFVCGADRSITIENGRLQDKKQGL